MHYDPREHPVLGVAPPPSGKLLPSWGSRYQLSVAEASSPELRGALRGVDRGRVVIGQRGDWELADPSLAPCHVALEVDDDGLWAEPIGDARVSVNGAPLDGRRPLYAGSTLQLGAVTLRVYDQDNSLVDVAMSTMTVRYIFDELSIHATPRSTRRGVTRLLRVDTPPEKPRLTAASTPAAEAGEAEAAQDEAAAEGLADDEPRPSPEQRARVTTIEQVRSRLLRARLYLQNRYDNERLERLRRRMQPRSSMPALVAALLLAVFALGLGSSATHLARPRPLAPSTASLAAPLPPLPVAVGERMRVEGTVIAVKRYRTREGVAPFIDVLVRDDQQVLLVRIVAPEVPAKGDAFSTIATREQPRGPGLRLPGGQVCRHVFTAHEGRS